MTQITEYNVVYIIDTSISIEPSELQTIKTAYTDLTNFYINEGIAENINFGITSFDTSGRFHTNTGNINLTGNEAITALQGLTIGSLAGTRYYEGLNRADTFLLNSPKNPFDTTGIGYFFTDGQNSGDRFDVLTKARDVRELANLQAIALVPDVNDPNLPSSIYGRDINWIDSANQGTFIDSISNLPAELLKSDLADSVESVNIMLDGEVVETLTPDQFTDSPLGLTYEGEIEELDVSIDAENEITAEVVFASDTYFETTTVEHTVTAGDGEVVDGDGNPIDESGNDSGDEDPFERERNGGDGDDEIILGYADRGANGGAGGDEIIGIGNNRDNILNGGAGNDRIYAHGGNDTITTGEGIDLVDAGEGIDTVLYSDITYQNNSNLFLSQSGNVVNYNNTDTLTNVEFIQFADVKVSAETLEVILELQISNDNDTIVEGSTESYTFELNIPAPTDVTFDYSTVDGSAIAGSDYTAIEVLLLFPQGKQLPI